MIESAITKTEEKVWGIQVKISKINISIHFKMCFSLISIIPSLADVKISVCLNVIFC